MALAHAAALVAGRWLPAATVGAVCTAIATVAVAFIAGHTATDLRHGGSDDDDKT